MVYLRRVRVAGRVAVGSFTSIDGLHLVRIQGGGQGGTQFEYQPHSTKEQLEKSFNHLDATGSAPIPYDMVTFGASDLEKTFILWN